LKCVEYARNRGQELYLHISGNDDNNNDDNAAAPLSSRNKKDPRKGRRGKVPESAREEFSTKHR